MEFYLKPKIWLPLVLTLISQVSAAGSRIHQFDGKTFFKNAWTEECALHIERISLDKIASTQVVATEMWLYRDRNNLPQLTNCDGTTNIRTCDEDGACVIDGNKNPTLWLLPDGNIVSFRESGATLKFYPSRFTDYLTY
jgi:hypothetical protein